MYPRKKLSEYMELAEQRGLEFCEEIAPRSVSTSVLWRCKRCNRSVKRSFTATRHSKNPCRCWNGIQVSEEEYHSLASLLSGKFGLTITFIPGQYLTQNTKQRVRWHLAQTDETFDASYRELIYNGVSDRVMAIFRKAKHADTPADKRTGLPV